MVKTKYIQFLIALYVLIKLISIDRFSSPFDILQIVFRAQAVRVRRDPSFGKTNSALDNKVLDAS